MERIHQTWHDTILQATRNSPVVPEFLAALTANESGGNPAARVFEAGVYGRLEAVIKGEDRAFGSLLAADLVAAAVKNFGVQEESPVLESPGDLAYGSSAAPPERALREMATSWGLTQIMGYQVIRWNRNVQDLLHPVSHYQFAVELLEDLGRRFHLSLAQDFEALFRAWNTGNPGGDTFDPEYAAQGIQRMRIYASIAEGDLDSLRIS